MAPPPPDMAITASALPDVTPSLPEANRSIRVPQGIGQFWRKLAAFAGPGYLVAVGYMDPGNWATDLAGGSAYGHSLLSVVLLSNLMAMFLQSLAAKLGIVTGRDLAQACYERYRPATRIFLWVLCELAIVACDLAEVIGTAIALELLFGIPLPTGVALTALDTLLILLLQQRGFRWLEAFVVALLTIIAGCFVVEIALAQPEFRALASGLVPNVRIATDPAMLYLAIGILGATVMPHNLYLHSAIVQTRAIERSDCGVREAIRFATLDSCIALSLAFLVNAAILVLAASTFHASGRHGVSDIHEAYHLLAPMLGASSASILFGVALLAAGQNSTVTATLAGQVVMEGFTRWRLRPWARRLITRAIAIVPAGIVAVQFGSVGVSKLLVLSQVVLSLQLPFAVIPLVRMTGDRALMGRFANSRAVQAVALGVATLIVLLNLLLLRSFVTG